MKALVRWTVGATSDAGIECLRHAVRSFRKLYGDELDYVICYNQLTDGQIVKISTLGVDAYRQAGRGELTFEPKGCAWKLYPPRLRPEAHEIVMDNDLIVHRRIDGIDAFLAGGGVMYSEGLFRNFGRFDALVPSGVKLNSGLYGVPPGYDLGGKLVAQMAAHPGGWRDFFDEQGMLAAVFCTEPVQHMIPMTKIQICFDGAFDPNRDGHHFVRLNADNDKAWDKYLRKTVM